MQKTILKVQEHLEVYSEELSKTLGFKPAVLGIMITETVNTESGLCEKMIKGASIVHPAMPDPDFIEFERRSLSPTSIDSSFYALMTHESEYHSENHEVEIHGILVFTNRPNFEEEFVEHAGSIVEKIINKEDLTEGDDELVNFHISVTDYHENPMDYRFEYMEDLEITVPEGQLADKYLCTGETCEDCGGKKETCC